MEISFIIIQNLFLYVFEYFNFYLIIILIVIFIKYIRYRPSGTPSDNPLEWWKYVFRGQKQDVDKTRRYHDWKYITQFIKDRNRYIYLYSHKKLSMSEKSIQMVSKN